MDRSKAYDELRAIAREVKFTNEDIDILEALLVVDNVTEVAKQIEAVIEDLAFKKVFTQLEADGHQNRLDAVMRQFETAH